MKTLKSTLNSAIQCSIALTLALLMSTPAWAIYDSGSDGSLGDLILKEDPKIVEVTLPTDGVLHYKSISVPAGVTLKFIPNDDNTQVVLLATGDVLIDGVIDVSGSIAFKCDKNPPYKGLDYCAGPGGPGGFSSGMDKQAGNGPGGGTGKTTTGLVNGFKTYGNAEWINLVGGSGSGAPSANQANSGGGGGAITIASSGAIVVNGQILANGGGNHGGGGKVRLVAETITGNGKVETAGGSNVAIGLIKLESHIITGGLAANSNPAPFLGTPQVSVPYAATKRGNHQSGQQGSLGQARSVSAQSHTDSRQGDQCRNFDQIHSREYRVDVPLQPHRWTGNRSAHISSCWHP